MDQIRKSDANDEMRAETEKTLPDLHQWKDAEPHPNFWTETKECHTALRQEQTVRGPGRGAAYL